MTTIMDVAKLAKVSKTSVSRYLNGQNVGHMSEETKERIIAAIKELDYQPNSIARSLKQKSTKVIGLVVNDMSNLFFLEIIRGIEMELKNSGYNLLVCNSDTNVEMELQCLKMLEKRQIDGVILIGMNMPVSHIEKIRTEFPIVLMERDPGKTNLDSVQIDNKVGAYDNAAGTAVVLETARQLTQYGLNKKIEILLTDGEEFNLKGARFRAAEERGDISFVLNIDGVGREDILEVWCGPETFERKVRAVLDKSKEKFIPRYICPPPPGSDHAPFYEKGIPVCMLTFNDQGILHTPEDIIEKSKLRNMEKMVRLNLELLERIGVIQRDTN